jgi:hypothetical protein
LLYLALGAPVGDCLPAEKTGRYRVFAPQ